MVEPAPGLRFVFAPELGPLSALMRATWDEPCLVYDEDVLKLHLCRPTADRSLSLAQCDRDGTPVTFHAFLPFQIEYAGRAWKAVFASFLTVARGQQRRGIVAPMQKALLERATERGHELYLVMCEVGAPSNEAIRRVFADRAGHFQLIHVFGYLMALASLLGPVVPAKSRGRTKRLAATDPLPPLDLIARLGHGLPLRKVVDPRDVAFVFRDRPHTSTFVFETRHGVGALANLLVLNATDGGVTRRNAYFDSLTFGDLTEQEREEFLGDVLLALLQTDIHSIFAPATGWVPPHVFRKFRFRLAPPAAESVRSSARPAPVHRRHPSGGRVLPGCLLIRCPATA